MSGRMTLGSLFVLALVSSGICQAQSGYVNGPSAPPGPWGASGQPVVAPQYPAYPAAGPEYCPTAPVSNTVFEQLPDDIGLRFADSPADAFLRELFKHAYFRGEWLLWSATGAQGALLGQTPAAGFLPSTVLTPLNPNTFTTTDPITSNPALAIEPSLLGFNLNAMNGYRGTIGLPTSTGAFEMSTFILATHGNTFNGTGLIQPAQNVTDPLTGVVTQVNPATLIGQVVNTGGSQTTVLYNLGYEALMQTSIWGTEANYVFNAPNEGAGDFITISPIAGMRYLNFRETLAQSGTYQFNTTPGLIPPTLASASRAIDSKSNNHAYGGQVGFRAEAGLPKFRFGAEPKIMLGLNTYDASLSMINMPHDTPSSNFNFNASKTATIFSPIADVKFYARAQLSQYLHAYVAYNIMYVGSLSRPFQNTNYNFTGAGSPNFYPTFSDVTIQGFSFGGELRY